MSATHTPQSVPERFLRHIWQHQYFSSANLQTVEGKMVEILFPGNTNTDGGPDFVDAQIRIGGVLYRGDVELHQSDDHWNDHAHHLDPKYNSVILHVVFKMMRSASSPVTKSKRTVPMLVLDRYIIPPDYPTRDKIIYEERAERLSGLPCSAVNEPVDGVLIRTWIGKLAVERIELKVRRFEERLRELVDRQRLSIKEPVRRYGEIPFGINLDDLPSPVSEYSKRELANVQPWNELLYEGIMEALGYSKNQAAFQKLAYALPLQFFCNITKPSPGESPFLSFEAILFGVSGLLMPYGKKRDTASMKHLRTLKRMWKIYRKQYRGEMLNEAEWQFFRLRPENFPTVRLAGVARLIPHLIECELFKSVIHLVKQCDDDRKSLKKLITLFVVSSDEFWSTHYLFGEEARTPIKKLIGERRALDIILNIIIPVCLLYARIFKEKDVRHGTLKIFELCSSVSDNVFTRLIDQELIRKKFRLDSAMLQQGALQLYKNYCMEKRCAECAVGNVVFKT